MEIRDKKKAGSFVFVPYDFKLKTSDFQLISFNGFIHIAPQPALARLGRDNYGVVCGMKMLGHMCIWRAIAAKRNAAGLAGSQV